MPLQQLRTTPPERPETEHQAGERLDDHERGNDDADVAMQLVEIDSFHPVPF